MKSRTPACCQVGEGFGKGKLIGKWPSPVSCFRSSQIWSYGFRWNSNFRLAFQKESLTSNLRQNVEICKRDYHRTNSLICFAQQRVGESGKPGGGSKISKLKNHAELFSGSKEARDALRWSMATVIENKAASADGSVRTLVLSVDDAVVYADGRRVRHVQENKRWLDEYKLPGQMVALRYLKGGKSLEDPDSEDAVVASRLFALASSPYETRYSSVSLDAAIIELLVYGKSGEEASAGDGHLRSIEESNLDDDHALASLAPGSLLQVSEVLGLGFNSLFNSQIDLQSCVEEGRPLLMIAVGCTGIAPVHAALDWSPVLAHAGIQPVTLVYVSENPASTSYLVEFDGWREAGVEVQPLYLGERMNESDNKEVKIDVLANAIENAVFGHHMGIKGVLGGNNPSEAAVVLSGVPGEVAAILSRKLTQSGISSERLLVCDYGV